MIGETRSSSILSVEAADGSDGDADRLAPIDPRRLTARERATLDALPIVAYVADAAGVLVFLSAEFERLTGFRGGDVTWPEYLALVHPDDAAARDGAWRRGVRDGSRIRQAFRIRTTAGSYRDVLSDGKPMRDRHGAIVGWLGTLTEIGELKSVQSALVESEAELRALMTSIPGATWSVSPSGRLTFASDRAHVSTPRELELLGDRWHELIHPDDLAATAAAFSHAMRTGEPYEREHRLRTGDGTYRWTLDRALPVRDEAGTIVRWAGVTVDVDAQRRALEQRERFERVVGASDDFIAIVYHANDQPSYVNAAGRALLGLASGMPLEDDVGHYLVAEDRERFEREIRAAIDRDGRWSGELRFRNATTRTTTPVATSAFSLFDATGAAVGLAMVNRDLRSQRRHEVGMRSLAGATRLMNCDLDVATTIQNVVAAIVQEFASTCIFDRLLDDGSICSHVATRRPRLPLELVERSAANRSLDDTHPAMRAAREGRSTLAASMPENWASRVGLSESEMTDAEIDVCSALYVPVRSGATTKIYGSLTCFVGTDDSRGGYTAEDVGFAEELASRAALALEHAASFEYERHIAQTLQQAMLPATLPSVPKLRLSAEYRLGSDEATVGGDWYDAFSVAGNRVVLAVGDVMGNGLQAARTMNKLRQSMRVAALSKADPGHILETADRVTCGEPDDVYATALVGVLDLSRGTFRYASGGHPAPFVRGPDGRVTQCSGTGLMLGVGLGERREISTVELEPGSSLVFFTDGLTELTRDIDAGLARVAEAVGEPTPFAEPNPARALVDRVLGGDPSQDDVAVLVATLDDA